MPHSPSNDGNPASHTGGNPCALGCRRPPRFFLVVIYAVSMEFLGPGLIGAGVGPISAALTGTVDHWWNGSIRRLY